MKFQTIFLQCVDQFLHDYYRDGVVAAGCNGPHNTLETALRNTSHWIISLGRAFRLTGKEDYKTAAIIIGAALLDETFRPYGFSFYARECEGVDRCNGLIGQAWTIEALAELHALTENSVYRDLGIELAKQHKFDAYFSVWHSLDIDGKCLNIDNVFNHQLWFCAAVALINHGHDTELNARLDSFMAQMDVNLSVSDSGLINHHIVRIMKSPRVRLQGLLKHLRHGSLLSRTFKNTVNRTKEAGADAAARDNGYHAFNTYAFAVMKTVVPEHGFWKSEKYHKLVAYLHDPRLVTALEGSIYGFPYNPPGFEIPFSLEILSEGERPQILAAAQFWLQRQISYSYNSETHMFDRQCADKATQSARLYEAARFSDWLFDILEVELLPDDGRQ